MLTPSWESSAGALAALLNSGAGLMTADLYTITLLGGQVLRYTNSDLPKTIAGNTWQAGPVLARDKIKLSVGITVDQLKITLSAATSVTVNGVPLMQFISRGGFVNARVQLDRLYAGGDGVPMGVLTRFTGRVSTTPGGRHSKAINVSSDTELLDTMVPRDVYQPGCKNTLFDAACGLPRPGLTTAGTAAGPTTDALRTTFGHNLPQTPGYFQLGVLRFTGGFNTGITRTVRLHTSGQFITLQGWPFAVGIGDAFTVEPGCDKLQATCSGKFSNLGRFRGEPYVPAAQTVIG